MVLAQATKGVGLRPRSSATSSPREAATRVPLRKLTIFVPLGARMSTRAAWLITSARPPFPSSPRRRDPRGCGNGTSGTSPAADHTAPSEAQHSRPRGCAPCPSIRGVRRCAVLVEHLEEEAVQVKKDGPPWGVLGPSTPASRRTAAITGSAFSKGLPLIPRISSLSWVCSIVRERCTAAIP